MNLLKQIVEISEPLHYVPLSGILEGKFYHTIFVPSNMKHIPYVVFEDGTSIEVKEQKGEKGGEKYSYFDVEGKRYVFNIQEVIWFQSGLVYSPDMVAVKDFLDDQIPEPQGLFRELTEQIKSYYDFCNDEELQIVAAHIIHSYFLGILGSTCYILLFGQKNSGKSSLQNVMARLQHNGCFVGKSSIAAMVRKIHYLQASINIDEFAKLDPKERVVVTGILNSGVYASGTKEIVNMDAKKSSQQIIVYRTFGTKTFSVNQAQFHESFISRCIVINTVRNRKQVKSIYGISAEEEEKFQKLRNQLFCYTLKHGQAICEDIQKMKRELEDKRMYGRRADIFAIILGVIKHFGGDVGKIGKYLEEKEELDSEDDSQNDRVYFMMKYLLEMAQGDNNDFIEFENKELLNAIVEGLELDDFDDPKYRPTAASVGRMLKNMKLVTGKKDRKRVPGRGNFSYVIPTERVIEIVSRSGFNDLVEMVDARESFTSSRNQSIQSENKGVNDIVNHSQDPSPPF